MDNNRLNRVYLSLKSSQRRLIRLSCRLDEPATTTMSEAFADMVQAQDDLIVLRETMQAREFDNAALREQLQDLMHPHPESGMPTRPSAPDSRRDLR